MAAKRIHEQETDHVETIKRLRKEKETNTTMADRLTDMPESLQLHILSFLETRHAVQTSMLSKSWVSSWTYIPVLNFSSYGFKKLSDFDKFVFDALSLREPVKLDKLTFNRHGSCSAKILKKVFDYAFSHGVEELEADITRSRACKGWPIRSHSSSDSLISLTLRSNYNMGCLFLEPRSGSFKNLTSLHLKRVIISDLDPFSGFPALEKLRLAYCTLNTCGYVLNIHAQQLSELIILKYTQHVNCIELKTPKLRCFEYHGVKFPRLTTHDQGGLPVLETVVIGYNNGFCPQNQEKIMFDNLLLMFNALCNARSLTIVSSIVRLLSLFPDELVNRCSPFWNLKCLKVDLRFFHYEKLFDGTLCSRSGLSGLLELLPGVIAYLLQRSRGAKYTIICPHGLMTHEYLTESHF
ncbi:hypothetical protein R6Q57_026669 [Mikania cordata]